VYCPFTEEELGKLVIPYHAVMRCAERASITVKEADRLIKKCLTDKNTRWSTKRPKFSRRCKNGNGPVYFAYSDCYKIVVVVQVGERARINPGCVLTVFGWDPIAQRATP